MKKKTAVKRLLQKGEPAPVRIVGARRKGPGLIVCDHASRRLPRALAKGFAPRADLHSHIGWDIGAQDLSLALGKKLDMAVTLATYSRLVVDLNRVPRHRECIPSVSCDIPVPGNASLSTAERRRRIDEVFRPYHAAVKKQVDARVKKGHAPFMIFLHSYTPELYGKKRPWHVGVLWDKEKKIAKTVMAALKKSYRGCVVGSNQPYQLRDERFKGSTADVHAQARGLPCIFIEVRNDLINTPAGVVRWTNILARALQPVLDDAATFAGRV